MTTVTPDDIESAKMRGQRIHEKWSKVYDRKALRAAPSREEMLQMFDVMTDGIKELSARIKELESSGYKGVWKNAEIYQRGAFVTDDGSLWHCNEPNTGHRPRSGDGCWTLAVKRGSR